jgi:hypothetical protein
MWQVAIVKAYTAAEAKAAKGTALFNAAPPTRAVARRIFSGAIEHNASPLPDAIRARRNGLRAARRANQALRTARRHNTSDQAPVALTICSRPEEKYPCGTVSLERRSISWPRPRAS